MSRCGWQLGEGERRRRTCGKRWSAGRLVAGLEDGRRVWVVGFSGDGSVKAKAQRSE